MNKADLIADVQEHLGLECSKAHAERAVQAVLGAIERGLQRDGEVQVVGFGTFQVKQRAARVGRNPQTSAPMQIAASTSVGFRVGAGLRKAVSDSSGGGSTDGSREPT
ncbi:MAG: HU family DNA-binding protein [Planctomycetota bacterium]